ncbi:MAG TPA: hypothetical protein VF607_10675 [Verrucomicrobiae bacterium]
MEPHERGFLNLVRIIGVLLVVTTMLLLGYYWASCEGHKPDRLPVETVPVLIRLIPAVLGFLVLLKARMIANWISELLDI